MSDHSQRLARAGRAKAELAETDAAYEKLKAALVEKLLATPLERQDLRERIYMAINAGDQMRAMLRDAVADGEMVNHEILLAEHGFQR